MTNDKQPEALRLANALEYCDASVARQATNELRRLHAENETLRAKLKAQLAAQQPGAVYAELPEPHHRGPAGTGNYFSSFTADQMRAFADATCAMRASHGQAPAQPDQPIACSYGDNGYACCEGGPCQADVHNDKLAEQQAPATAQAADSVPAVEREQERIAFKDAHRHLDMDEVPDAWGRPMFKHSHVEASWLGWIARASHGQAPTTQQAGWRLVPLEPTDEMLEATYAGQHCSDVYRDMLAAAPQPSPAAQEGK